MIGYTGNEPYPLERLLQQHLHTSDYKLAVILAVNGSKSHIFMILFWQGDGTVSLMAGSFYFVFMYQKRA